jgi:hypothetical protein
MVVKKVNNRMGVKTGSLFGRVKEISLKWKVAALIIVGFLAFIAIANLYEGMTTAKVSVEYPNHGRITVSYPKKEYQPGDTVPLKVEAYGSLAVGIETIRLCSSISGLENVTLFSGGAFWGVTIEPDEFSSDTKECEFTLPQDMEKRGNIDINILVELQYATRLYMSFTNHWASRTLTITLNVQ